MKKLRLHDKQRRDALQRLAPRKASWMRWQRQLGVPHAVEQVSQPRQQEWRWLQRACCGTTSAMTTAAVKRQLQQQRHAKPLASKILSFLT